MVYLIFKDTQLIGFSPRPTSSDDPKEKVIKKEEEELNDILKDVLREGQSWFDKRKYLKLDEEGNVVLNQYKFVEYLKFKYEIEEVSKGELEDMKNEGKITQSEYDYIIGGEE